MQNQRPKLTMSKPATDSGYFYLLYLAPPSFLYWLCRGTYIGILLSVYFFLESFSGEFNLLYPVAGDLVLATSVGLISFEIGAWAGAVFSWRNRRDLYPAGGKPESAFAPMAIFLVALFASLALFYLRGVPMLSDPLDRALIGQGLGILKRCMFVFLPVSALEIFALFLRRKAKRFVWPIVGITLMILLGLAFKSILFFLVIFFWLAIYRKEKEDNPKWSWYRSRLSLFVLLLLLAVVWLYAKGSEDITFLRTMTVRVTNLISQSPNYIVNQMSSFSGQDIVINDLRGIAQTFRLPYEGEVLALDTELSKEILNRNVEAGGLNPTVIGYGWLIGRYWGVCLLSAFYGFLMSLVIRGYLFQRGCFIVAMSLFAAFAVFNAVQIFSPIGVALDTGLSLLGYAIAHFFINGFVRKPLRTCGACMWTGNC